MLIGISGKIGSGKNALADAICAIDPEITQHSYAYKLKKVSAYLLGLDVETMFTQDGKNLFLKDWKMTVGEFQQKLGTEGMRMGVHQNGWVLALFADYNPGDKWVITDLRFENEAIAVKKRGGILVRVEGDPASIRANSSRNMKHTSEISLDNWLNWDYKFENTYSDNYEEILKERAKSILNLTKVPK